MATPEKAALVTGTTLIEDYWPRADGLSAVNTNGKQLRDLINSGLTRSWIMLLLLMLLSIHIFSVLSLQLKKLRRHKSAINLSNANPTRGHKEV